MTSAGEALKLHLPAAQIHNVTYHALTMHSLMTPPRCLIIVIDCNIVTFGLPITQNTHDANIVMKRTMINYHWAKVGRLLY